MQSPNAFPGWKVTVLGVPGPEQATRPAAFENDLRPQAAEDEFEARQRPDGQLEHE